MAQDGNVFGGSTTMEPPWNHHETTREPCNHHETTTKPPGNLNTNVLDQKQSNLGTLMEYGKRCQFRNGPIWETYGTRVFVVWYIQWWPNPRFSSDGMFLARFSEGGQ